MKMMIIRVDAKLLELLVCTITCETLNHNVEQDELYCRASSLSYPIKDGIPIMLPEETKERF